jgi:hypothetical protein
MKGAVNELHDTLGYMDKLDKLATLFLYAMAEQQVF